MLCNLKRTTLFFWYNGTTTRDLSHNAKYQNQIVMHFIRHMFRHLISEQVYEYDHH